jgi:hypothetical protein
VEDNAASSVHYVVDDAASTGGYTVWRTMRHHRYTPWWMTQRVPVHYVVDDAASTGTLRGG